MLSAFGVAFALIVYKLATIQAGHNPQLQAISDAATRTIPLPGLRGSILASNGDELAFSEMRPFVFANPTEVTASATDAVTLAPLLRVPAVVLQRELTERTTYVVLAENVSQTTVEKVDKLDFPGIGIEQEPVRFYPDGSLARSDLGAVNAAGDGYQGLELEYNNVLAGRPGEQIESVDLQGQPIPGSVTTHPAKNGEDILTTIDEGLQYDAEQALATALRTSKGKDGVALVMDTKTGDLLAVANMVNTKKGPVEAPDGLAFNAVYEPGSVAKIVTLSAGLSEGIITPTTKVNIPTYYDVAGTAFHDDTYHPDYTLTATGILAQSSDVGALQIGERLGPQREVKFLHAFGLDEPTGVGFPGESYGILPPISKWSGTTLATLSYGQGVAVTAAQMVAAANVVANGGVYVPPRLVVATVDTAGKEHVLPAGKSRRVLSPEVDKEMTAMMEQVVSSGTGTAAQIPGYAVAGKTGTGYALAQSGGYITDRYASSFAGFAPAQDPAVTVMVQIDDTPYFGAQAAAPAFHTLMSDALVQLAIPSTGVQPKPSILSVPILDGHPETYLLGL